MLHIIVDYWVIVVVLFVLVVLSDQRVGGFVQSVDSPYRLLE